MPKDGPSAGVTMVTALVSALSGRPVSEDVAMTGEITLTGQVLPIGGVKEKVLAARRAGIGGVILPKLNEDQLADLPPGLAEEMRITLADRVEQVLDVALATGLEQGERPGADQGDADRVVIQRPRGAATSMVMASPATSIRTGPPSPTNATAAISGPQQATLESPCDMPGAQRVAGGIGSGGPAGRQQARVRRHRSSARRLAGASW